MKRAKIALAGVGGYGSAHVEAAQILAAEGLLEVQAFADPRRHVEAVAQLEAAGARHYLDYNEMLELEEELDAVCIATPIPCHVPMIAAAFDKGLHVFAEKPPAVCIQDLHMLVAKQQQSGCLCAVGYQDIARPAVLALKQRLCDGVLGPIRAIRAECRWQRPARYYSRNDWAGKLERDGVWVLDGPLNNACSHVLNLAAFLAGPAPYEFARPLSVEAELYRANAIESEDTDCLRAKMDTGVELCVHLTQCAALSHPRSWTIIGDEGAAVLRDGQDISLPQERIAAEDAEPPLVTLLRRLIEVVLGSDEPLLMPLAEAESHLLMSNGAFESTGAIHTISPSYTRRTPHNGDHAVVIQAVDESMLQASSDGLLLSECGAPWAVPSQPFDLAHYESFPQQWCERAHAEG